MATVVRQLMKRPRVDGEVGVTDRTVTISVSDVDEVVLWDNYVAKQVHYEGSMRAAGFTISSLTNDNAIGAPATVGCMHAP